MISLLGRTLGGLLAFSLTPYQKNLSLSVEVPLLFVPPPRRCPSAQPVQLKQLFTKANNHT
jgi:hypothetical protein